MKYRTTLTLDNSRWDVIITALEHLAATGVRDYSKQELDTLRCMASHIKDQVYFSSVMGNYKEDVTRRPLGPDYGT